MSDSADISFYPAEEIDAKTFFFACWVILHAFLLFAEFFSKIDIFKNFFQEYNTIKVSYSLDPDQAQHFVRPDWVQTICKC